MKQKCSSGRQCFSTLALPTFRAGSSFTVGPVQVHPSSMPTSTSGYWMPGVPPHRLSCDDRSISRRCQMAPGDTPAGKGQAGKTAGSVGHVASTVTIQLCPAKADTATDNERADLQREGAHQISGPLGPETSASWSFFGCACSLAGFLLHSSLHPSIHPLGISHVSPQYTACSLDPLLNFSGTSPPSFSEMTLGKQKSFES